MMSIMQRLKEWDNIDKKAYSYHKSQWDVPKRGTIAFEQFIQSKLIDSISVIDLGAGSGAATAFLATQHKSVNFTAFDYSSELLSMGKIISKERSLDNLSFEQGDWYNLRLDRNYDGCVSLQTLSWLPDFEHPVISIFKDVKPKWIGLTSLFYEGDITCRIEVEEHKRKRKTFYNIYSLQSLSRVCEQNGYSLKKYMPFEIDVDIDKPDDPDYMGTYTKRTVDETNNEFHRLQISGPLLMNWYMVLIEKAI